MTMKRSALYGIVILVILIACAGCGELPPEGQDGAGGIWGTKATPTITTPTATPSYLTPATPFVTPTYSQPPTSTATPTPVPLNEYVEIYNDTIAFNFETLSYAYDLLYPPMVINIEIHPELVEREVVKTSDYGTKKEVTIKQLLPDDRAAFKITVYDKITGDIVAEEGYGRIYASSAEKQEIVIRVPGLYQIDMTGSRVEIDVSISVAEQNIA